MGIAELLLRLAVLFDYVRVTIQRKLHSTGDLSDILSRVTRVRPSAVFAQIVLFQCLCCPVCNFS